MRILSGPDLLSNKGDHEDGSASVDVLSLVGLSRCNSLAD